MRRLKRNRRDLSIIIPAAGMGRRMKSYGPKPLIELDNRQTVLSRQLRILRMNYPTADIVAVLGFESERIIKTLPQGIKVVENECFGETNVVRSIGMGLRVASHQNVLVVYGDLVFNQPTIENITQSGSVVVVDTHDRFGEDEVGCNILDGRVTSFSYGLETKWAQIAYLTGRELDLFKKSAWHADHRRWFGYEALNAVVEGGGRLRAVEPKGMQVIEIDSSKDIEKARSIV